MRPLPKLDTEGPQGTGRGTQGERDGSLRGLCALLGYSNPGRQNQAGLQGRAWETSLGPSAGTRRTRLSGALGPRKACLQRPADRSSVSKRGEPNSLAGQEHPGREPVFSHHSARPSPPPLHRPVPLSPCLAPRVPAGGWGSKSFSLCRLHPHVNATVTGGRW